VFQAAHLVTRVARHGMADAGALAASLGSVFALDPPDVPSVFGGPEGLRDGLRVLRHQLEAGRGARDLEVTRYVVGLLHLERRLRRRPYLLRRIREGIQAILDRPAPPAPTDPEVVEALAEVYTETVSTLGPRIIVRGEPGLLARPETAARVRALLLAGIRATVLWRHCGGTRLGLLFGRRRLLEVARALAEGSP
jgi:high frequency lysogenization protein